jgi:hypothetical protein
MKNGSSGRRKLRVLVTSLAAVVLMSADSGRSLARGVTGWSNCEGDAAPRINCGGIDPTCRIASIVGDTDASGGVDAEIDWDDGGGFGENQQLGSGPGHFQAVWDHTYTQNGLYHVKMELEDGDGNKCTAFDDVQISG